MRVVKLRLGPAVSEFGLGWDLAPEAITGRTNYWVPFGLRDARMMSQNNMSQLLPFDVARAIVDAVSQPRHVLFDTIELQPAVPKTSPERESS